MTDESIPETTLADTSAVSASASEESALPAADVPGTPTVAEAETMFPDNPGLSAVLTTDGWLTRDGVLYPALSGE